jgi:hypothetical protein
MDNKTNCIKKGGKKPHAHLLPMMVLVLFGMIALVGVAAADSVYHGAPPVTNLSGTVYGGVDVKMSPDPWNAGVSYTDRNPQYCWGNVSFNVTPNEVELDFARLYVVVYGGSMSANYTGSFGVDLYNGDDLLAQGNLVSNQKLNLAYNNVTMNYPAYNTSITAPLLNLSRVTSDYIAVFDIKDRIKDLDTNNLNVKVTTCNETGSFDGRVKTVQLAYGWNPKPIKYWINEGHDPMTKYGGNGYSTFNETWFNDAGDTSGKSATLWIDFMNNVSQGDGVYKWNDNYLDGSIISKPTVLYNGKYAGLNYLTWETSDAPGILDNNKLSYARGPNDWYKINFAVLSIK